MLSLIPLLLVATLHSAPPADCDNRRTRGTSTSIHSDSHDESSVINYTRFADDRCESATILGKLTYTPEEDDVLSVPFGGSAIFRERTSSNDRALSITRGADGQVVRAYQLDGHAAAFDADARRWFADVLTRVLMMSGINVGPRVARWKAKGGVDNVLTHIESMESSGAMRNHYEELLNNSQLNDDELERAIRSVSDHMRQSSGDLRHVLSRLVPRRNLSKQTLTSLESALIFIPSSSDKAAVLEQYGQSANRELLTIVIHAAESIQSSGDKSRVLVSLAARYMESDVNLRRNYFDVAESVQSSGDRAAVLINLARSGLLREQDARDGYVRVAAGIQSSGDKARVLEALAYARQ